MEESSLRHLGIIADGNRRWAREKNLPTLEGHKKGLETIEMAVSECAKNHIPFVTVYVFSTENWNRSEEEVSYLMKLFFGRIKALAEKMAKNNVKLVFLSRREKLDPKLLAAMDEAESITKECTGTTASFCFNYGGEQEIVDAAKSLANTVHREFGPYPTASDIDGYFTIENFAKHLYHPEVPPVDMIVRTSGEERISGFMLWRASYSEFMFLKKYFPDLTPEDIQNIIKEYENRNRRFGK